MREALVKGTASDRLAYERASGRSERTHLDEPRPQLVIKHNVVAEELKRRGVVDDVGLDSDERLHDDVLYRGPQLRRVVAHCGEALP